MEIVEKLYLKWCEFGGCKKFVTLAVTSVWRFLPMHGLSSSTRFFAWMFFYTFVTFFPHLFRDFVEHFCHGSVQLLHNSFTFFFAISLFFAAFCERLQKTCKTYSKKSKGKLFLHFTVVLPIHTFFTLFYNCFSNLHFLHTFFCTCFSHSPFCYTFYTCPTHTFFTVVFPIHTFFIPFLQLYFQFTLFLHFLYTFFVRKLQKKCKKSENWRKSVKKVSKKCKKSVKLKKNIKKK